MNENTTTLTMQWELCTQTTHSTKEFAEFEKGNLTFQGHRARFPKIPSISHTTIRSISRTHKCINIDNMFVLEIQAYSDTNPKITQTMIPLFLQTQKKNNDNNVFLAVCFNS